MQIFFMLTINGKCSIMAVKWWGGWAESEKVDTIMKHFLNELHSDETSFLDMHSPFREVNKWLSSEQREDPLASSVFLSSLTKLQASLMQSVVTSVTSDATGMQSPTSIQACSGLNMLLFKKVLQIIPHSKHPAMTSSTTHPRVCLTMHKLLAQLSRGLNCKMLIAKVKH